MKKKIYFIGILLMGIYLNTNAQTNNVEVELILPTGNNISACSTVTCSLRIRKLDNNNAVNFPIEIQQLEINDYTGRQLTREKISLENKRYRVDTHLLSTGIYFLKLSNSKGILFTGKLNVINK